MEPSGSKEIPFLGEFQEREVRSGKLNLYYTEWGNRDSVRRPLVMVHGLNVQSHTWDPIASDMALDRKVYCLDLRGHGRSDWSQDGYRTEQFSGDVRALIESLQLHDFDLLGHSLGVRIAVHYAARHGIGSGRLALSDLSVEMSKELAAQLQAGAEAAVSIAFDSEDAALAYYSAAHPTWESVFHRLHAHYQLAANWAHKLVPRADPQLRWVFNLFCDDPTNQVNEVPELWSAARALNMPTLLMWGRRSDLLTDEGVRAMRDAISGLTVSAFDTGHYIPREASGQFTTELRAFLDG